jgi:hypothetical protein
VAALIGVNIQKGECEIFPSDSRGQVGYGIRAPGTWNPKHDTFSLIAFENVSPLLSAHTEERKRVSLSYRSSQGVKDPDLTHRNEVSVYRGEFDEWQTRFAITALRTRREELKMMVDHIFRQVGRDVARRNAEVAIQWKDRDYRSNPGWALAGAWGALGLVGGSVAGGIVWIWTQEIWSPSDQQ